MHISIIERWQNLNTRMQAIIVFVIVMVFFGLVAIWQNLNAAKVHIISDPESTLFVASEPGGEFIEVGKEEATYSTNKEGTYFVRSLKNGNEVIKSVELIKRKTVEAQLDLGSQLAKEQVGERALSYPYIENQFMYGLNLRTGSVGYAPLGSELITNFRVFGLNFLDKVFWESKDNFYFFSPIDGIGRVVKGKVLAIPKPAGSADAVYYDIDKHDDRPLIILGSNGLNSYEPGKGAKKIGDITTDVNSRVFADRNNIYVTSLVFAEVENAEEDHSSPTATKIDIFGYDGTPKGSYELPSIQFLSRVFTLADDASKVAMLGDSKFSVLDTNTGLTVDSSYYFKTVADAIDTPSGLFVYTDLGLWEYDVDAQLFRLITGAPDNEDPLAHTFLFNDKTKSLYFGTQIPRDASLEDGSSSIYRVKTN